jgi:hypothetical protein
MFGSYEHLQAEIYININIQNSVALDGNPEPGLVHATGCKQPTLRMQTTNFKYVDSAIRAVPTGYFPKHFPEELGNERRFLPMFVAYACSL